MYVPAFVMLLAASLRTVTAQPPTEYPLTADSERQAGVPFGQLPGDGEPDDPGADDRDVALAGGVLERPGQGGRSSTKKRKSV